jgi:O-antigen/teichoic acid export membrane protein
MFIINSILPRILGPLNYGNFDFLTDISNKIINFFDNGISIAFFTKLSHNKHDKKIIKYTNKIIVLICVFFLLISLSTYYNNIYNFIWPNQKFLFVFFSCILAIITFYSNILYKIFDAVGLTMQGEMVKLFNLLFSLILFSIIFLFFKTTSLEIFYLVQILLMAIVIVISFILLTRNNFTPVPNIILSNEDTNKLNSYFWNYSSPLLLYGIIILISTTAERWILQKFGGALEQGYFAIANKLSAFVFIFTGAMMPLLMREISKSFANADISKIKNLFLRNFKILYFIVSFLSVFVAINAKFIVSVIGGQGYESASQVVILMSFYPIHQTIGQINGTIYMSTERTKTYKNISIITAPFSIVLSYILIAPLSEYGFNLGALGLAIQMLIIQFISQNLLLYYNCKFLKVNFWVLLFYQIMILILMLSIELTVKFLTSFYFTNNYLNTLFNSLLSFSIVLLIIMKYPKLIGLKHKNILNILLTIRNTKNKFDETY